MWCATGLACFHVTPIQLPTGSMCGSVCLSCVCVCVQEEYLSGEEFSTVFKMEREAFLKLPQWKRLQLKKSTLLF